MINFLPRVRYFNRLISLRSHRTRLKLGTPQQETDLLHALLSRTDYARRTGDNYPGMSLGNLTLSVKGNAFSILGIEIDTEEFASPDTDEPDPSDLHSPLYNKSYQAFIRTILDVRK